MKPTTLPSKVLRRLIRVYRSAAWRLITATSRQRLYRFTLVDGSAFDCPINTSIARMLFMGSFENSEIEFVRHSLKPGDVFLDIGANAGIYTVLAGKLVGPGGHVYAFEPSTRELETLRHNIELNRLENVTVVARAVSNRVGTARLAIARDGGLNSFADTHRPDQQIEAWQEVEITKLDHFLREFSIPKVNFIKLDVEGAEKLVFEGAAALLASMQPVTILFEASDFNTRSYDYSVEALLNQFLERRGNLYVLEPRGKLRPLTAVSPACGNGIYNFVLLPGTRRASGWAQ